MKFRRTLTRPLVALLVALTAAGAIAQEPDRSVVLNLATNADPTLNPWSPGAVIESNLINTILFEQLTRYSPEDLTPSPMLATDWYAEDGGLAWVFELREGVVWSDGDPFDAADVAFTFNDVVLNPD
ncbi:MAG TPA: ABC transporter substrate-binding protein, partial [Trueperaceae bacterium]|nr:ABC transporter substrate-binding protein [Trueperaceae bacterium]